MKFLSICVLAVGTYVVSADDHGWSYEGANGPDAWGRMNIGGNQCGLKRQSPIDIEVQRTQYDPSLKPLKMTGYDQFTTNVTIVNNGHSVQLNSPNWQQTLTGGPLDGTYKMLQMHFHWGKDSYRGSEHTINGKRYPIELHMVHIKQQDAGAPMKLGVLGIMFEVTKGESAPGIKKITRVIKNMKTHDAVDIPSDLSANMLLPENKDFFTYEGSLTTPPCSEIVTWVVFKGAIPISEDDLATFRSCLFEDNKPMVDNFRPTLPLEGRTVRSSFMTASANSLGGASIPFMILSALLCNY